MIIVGAVVAVLVLGALAAWAITRSDVPGVTPAVTSASGRGLPAGPLRADDVHDLRFEQVMRGYRMDQVDDALARLADELADRDVEIARLRAGAEPEVARPGADRGDS